MKRFILILCVCVVLLSVMLLPIGATVEANERNVSVSFSGTNVNCFNVSVLQSNSTGVLYDVGFNVVGNFTYTVNTDTSSIVIMLNVYDEYIQDGDTFYCVFPTGSNAVMRHVGSGTYFLSFEHNQTNLEIGFVEGGISDYHSFLNNELDGYYTADPDTGDEVWIDGYPVFDGSVQYGGDDYLFCIRNVYSYGSNKIELNYIHVAENFNLNKYGEREFFVPYTGVFDGVVTDDGYDTGYEDGYAVGKNDGIAIGEQNGYDTGYSDGKSDGYLSGYTSGRNIGYKTGYDDGYDTGYSEGESDGAASVGDVKYSIGYRDGFTAGEQSDVSKNFVTIIGEIARVPFLAILNIFNFEIFGINVSYAIFFVLTISVVLLVLGIILRFIFR